MAHVSKMAAHGSGDGSPVSSALGKSARNRIRNITGTQVQCLLRKLDALSVHLPWLTGGNAHLPMQELVSPRDYMPHEVSASTGQKRAIGKGGEDADAGMGRHVLQESSILGHLRRIGALDDDDDDTCNNDEGKRALPTTAIEFGAGTGRLSERLQRSTNCRMKHVLVDRQDFAPGKCREGAMRNRVGDDDNKRDMVLRITSDIADFQLGEYCSFIDGVEPKWKCLCMSKHLCGPACDLAISVLGGRDVPAHRRPPFAFATCCHYLCTWESFAGREYWLKLGLTEEDFDVAVAASQWYSLEGKKKKKQTKEDGEQELPSATPIQTKCTKTDLISAIDNAGKALKNQSEDCLSPSISSEEFERTFPREEKAKLGGTAKRLLDLARIARLQEMGYDAELILYTTKSIENRLLVGRMGCG